MTTDYQAEPQREKEADKAPKTDAEFLKIVAAERQRSIGFDQNGNLFKDRERALNYIKGEMDDLPVMENRSRAVSTDVNDAIETILPDLVDIFTGGDDVASFQPVSPDDEEKAQQETDYINHVFFQENPGFKNIYTIVKDASQQKIGIGYVIWEEDIDEQSEDFEGKTAAEMMLAAQDGEIVNARPVEADEGQYQAEPLYAFTLKRRKDYSCAKVLTVPPEDFTVSPDTVELADTPYCAMRTYPRAQDLIAGDVDQKTVDALPAYSVKNDDAIDQARDTASEHATSVAADTPDYARTVEVLDHYVRTLGSNGKDLEIWRIRTGNGETVFIDKEKVPRIPFAAGTPYPVTHRFYGRSVADLLMEVQKIKTAMTRALLDSMNFSLNQRFVIGESGANEFTISDLLNNVPLMPIRAKDATAIVPLQSPGLGFDAFSALEYFDTVSEKRTGIVRSAQGLNPDTLHETAQGVLALLTNSQKRLRLIARVLGETCLKPLFLLLHGVIRENATEPRIVRLNQKWVEVDPSTWAERNDLTIEIGVGASGREHDIQGLGQIAGLMEKIGASPYAQRLISPENIYNLASTTIRKLGFKAPEKYITDPSTTQDQPPPPDPKMAETQGKLQLQQQSQQFDQQTQMAQMQADQQAAQQKFSLDQMKAESDAQIQREKNAADIQLQREIAAQELQLKREQYAAELDLKRWEIEQELQLKAAGIVANTHVAMDRNAQVNVGGEPG